MKVPVWAKEDTIMSIAPFKVIQGHRFRYLSKAHMRLPMYQGPNSNLHLPPILHRFQDKPTSRYWSKFRRRQVAPLFNALAGGEPLNSGWGNLTFKTGDIPLSCDV